MLRKANAMPEIFDSAAEWQAQYESGWLAHYEATGEIDWSLYPRPRNREAVGVAGRADLRESRLLFVTSAGAYLPASQENATTTRTIWAITASAPSPATRRWTRSPTRTRITRTTPWTPTRRCCCRCATWRLCGTRGTLARWRRMTVSFMGYQPDVAAPRGGNSAANRRLCQRSGRARRAARASVTDLRAIRRIALARVGTGRHRQRGYELAGQRNAPDETAAGDLHANCQRGSTLGNPGDAAQQLRVLRATLATLEQDAPLAPITLDEG